jgi:hypothetical protein
MEIFMLITIYRKKNSISSFVMPVKIYDKKADFKPSKCFGSMNNETWGLKTLLQPQNKNLNSKFAF